jgi:hypothetical protein
MTGAAMHAAAPTTARGKAIALLSGGLDSTLAVSAMLEQNIEVLALNFVGPFCTCSPRKEDGCHLASKVARRFGVEIRVLSKGMDYLQIVEHPRFGRGCGLNPCIDCRIFMLRKAALLMEEVGASFVVTGEVLGQRPMSQHRAALDLIERASGLAGRLLRPLSAHLLDETIPETEGTVRRDLLMGFQGRTRKPQNELARAREIDVFGCPGGGCLLTDPLIARRMRDVFAHCPNWNMQDAKLTTLGRHLRLHDGLKVIIGRNDAENDRLQNAARDLPIVEFTVASGPTAVLRGRFTDTDLDVVGRLLRFFAKKVTTPQVELELRYGGERRTWGVRECAGPEEVARWTI